MKSFAIINKSLSALLALSLIILPVLACKSRRSSSGGSNRTRTQPQRPNNEPNESGNPNSTQTQGNYVGDINGAQAVANVSFEPLREYTIMAGEIRSNNFYYTFKADIVGESGYGDILDHSDNSRFRIKIDLTSDGFVLTSNPLGPGNPTTYYFRRQ
jgi:hypothetical protein